MKKGVRLLLAALLLWVAALQLNDPDPVYWVTVYAAAAGVLAAAAFGRAPGFWGALVVGGVVAGMLMSVTGFLDYLTANDFGSLTGEMMPDKPYVEEAREFIGLSLALAALAWSMRS